MERERNTVKDSEKPKKKMEQTRQRNLKKLKELPRGQKLLQFLSDI